MTRDAIDAIHRVGGATVVAREAGLSRATVENAMSGHGVHRSTAKAIAEAIERLGERVHEAEVSNTTSGTIYHIACGLTTYRIRVRLASDVRYRADVHYQLRHGETAWNSVGRVEAGTKADLVIAAKAAAKSRIQRDRERAMESRRGR